MSIRPPSFRALCHRSVFLFACMLLAILCMAPRAAAQGTMGMLPGPMTTPEVDGYARRLDLSPQQRRALDAVHDMYKQEFRELREGEIARFLEKMRDMQGVMPARKTLEDFLQQMEALARKIAIVDNHFFDQLQPALTEQQLPMLQRVRQARERARLNGMQMMWMGGERPLDLSAILLDVELNDAERQAADPIMASYEGKLTNDMGKMYGNTQSMILEMYEAMERMGIDENSMQDPEQAEKVGQAMQEVFQGMMAKTQAAAAEIAALNDRTYQSVAAVLERDKARTFRNRYYRQAYPEAGFALFMHDYVFAPALKRDDLTPEQREAVTAARDEMFQRLDAILEETVITLGAYRQSMSPFNYDQEKAADYQKKQQELSAKADDARKAANTALEAALGTELLDKIGRVKAAHEDPQDEEDGAAGAEAQVVQQLEAESSEEGEASDVAWGVDQFLPPAISEGEVAEFSERLSLTEEQRGVLQDLYQRYTESFEQLSKADFAKLQEAVSAMWRYDEEAQVSRGPTVETINETYRLRSAALEAIKRADESFFAEMELAVLTPEQQPLMPRVRQARERSIYNRGGAQYWGGGSTESSIDLARLAQRRRAGLAPEQWAAVDAELLKYEQASIPLFRERYAKSLEAQKVQELWSAEINRAQAEGESNQIALGMRYQEMMREPQKALGEASAAVSELNRNTLSTLMAALPGEEANTLRRDYNTRAFPNVYNDSGAMDEPLTRARALPDLTEEQGRLLGDLAAEYHPAYTAMCDAMVKASEGSERSNVFAGMDEEAVMEWQKREEVLAKLRFDRAELNARAASKISAVLSEDQVKRLGGLPKIEQVGDFDW